MSTIQDRFKPAKVTKRNIFTRKQLSLLQQKERVRVKSDGHIIGRWYRAHNAKSAKRKYDIVQYYVTCKRCKRRLIIEFSKKLTDDLFERPAIFGALASLKCDQ